MDNMVKVSIIMPVYGVEDYVGKAIESIQAQTLADFEFLIVDDGTKDNSGVICDAYAAKDSRLYVIHKENGGAPSARNMAIEIANGKYFYFMDSDDWVEPTMLEDLVNLAEKNQAQLVICGFFIDTYHNDTDYITQHLLYKDMVYENKQAFHKDAYQLFDRNQLYSPWNKLFLADYIMKNNIRFPATFWDDFPFIIDVIRDVENIVVSSNQYYHFIRKRVESETAKYNPGMYQKREEEHQWMLDLYTHWNVDDENSREMIARRYIERLVGCIENMTNPNTPLKKNEKKESITQAIQKQEVKEQLKLCKPRSIMMKVLIWPIKCRNVMLVYMFSAMISYVRRNNVRMFAVLKARR